MKISMSYTRRGERIHAYKSLPFPTVEDLTEVIKTIAWVASQEAPEVEVIES